MASQENITAREERGLELLWEGHGPDQRSKPGLSLSLESIVATGIRIADAEGLERLSMRRVAADLGAGTMSLYRYVPGKEELIHLMVDAVTGETPLPDPAPPGWRARLAWSAKADWSLYRRHLWALQVLATTRPPLGPNVLTFTEFALASVDHLGLRPDRMSWLVMMVTSYVQGAALLLVNETAAQRDTDTTHQQWWARRSSLIMDLIQAERFPTLAKVAAAGDDHDDLDAWFDFGLQRLLDGIAVFLTEGAAEPLECQADATMRLT